MAEGLDGVTAEIPRAKPISEKRDKPEALQSATQGLQYPLIGEYTSNYSRIPNMITPIPSLTPKTLEAFQACIHFGFRV